MKKPIQVFFVLVGISFVIIAIHLFEGITFGRKIEYKKISFRSKKFPQVLDGYRIAFITDTHAISKESLKKIVAKLDRENLDLLLLGGDFATKDYKMNIEVLGKTQAKDGIYGVEGNHDQFKNTFAAMNQNGIIPLSNSGVKLHEGFFLAGVEDLWNRNPDLVKASQDAQKEDFVLVLSHNPDVSMQQDDVDFDLMLSGHTHGGQVTFFGFFAPAVSGVSYYGQRFQTGWCKGTNERDVYVSNGTGLLKRTPRIFARPQVIILTLHHEKDLAS